MLELELEIEALDALIKIIDAQPAPLPWHLIDARCAMQEALDNEYERRAHLAINAGYAPAIAAIAKKIL